MVGGDRGQSGQGKGCRCVASGVGGGFGDVDHAVCADIEGDSTVEILGDYIVSGRRSIHGGLAVVDSVEVVGEGGSFDLGGVGSHGQGGARQHAVGAGDGGNAAHHVPGDGLGVLDVGVTAHPIEAHGVGRVGRESPVSGGGLAFSRQRREAHAGCSGWQS